MKDQQTKDHWNQLLGSYAAVWCHNFLRFSHSWYATHQSHKKHKPFMLHKHKKPHIVSSCFFVLPKKKMSCLC